VASRVITAVTTISKISARAESNVAALVVIAGDDLGKKLELVSSTKKNSSGDWIIGRSSGAHLQVDQESVSRKHAMVSGDEKGFVLADLQSTNGTFVNDRMLKSVRRLKHGDLVKIGRTVLKFIDAKQLESSYHEEIYRLTTVDALTQIFNRRYFEDALAREFSRCRRYGRALSLVLFDVDRFKKINDTHGHLVGDAALKKLATLIGSKIRKEDVFARYGGEEFALLLPEIDEAGATAFAEKVRKLVEQAKFSTPSLRLKLTISAGVATVYGSRVPSSPPPKGKGRQTWSNLPGLESDFVQEADAQLYRAKREGRNRVSCALH
jgi:two-component system, cell cycle response regulator